MEECSDHVHVPVMPDEVLNYLRPEPGKIYVDGTLGLGGHAQLILQASEPDGKVIAFEWDRQAALQAMQRLRSYEKRVRLVPTSYAMLLDELARLGIDEVDGILLDLGVSSLQLDDGQRGFSFQVDAPLDMRMDRSKPQTAAKLVNSLSREDLADIFRQSRGS